MGVVLAAAITAIATLSRKDRTPTFTVPPANPNDEPVTVSVADYFRDITARLTRAEADNARLQATLDRLRDCCWRHHFDPDSGQFIDGWQMTRTDPKGQQ